MRKKLRILFAALAMCLLLVTPAYAAGGKPNVELMYFSYERDSAGGCSPTFYFRNNSGKAIKYLDWYVTLYNRVNDPTPNDLTKSSSVCVRTVGPIEPDSKIATPDKVSLSSKTDFYFARYFGSTGKKIAYNNAIHDINVDEYGNYFFHVKPEYNPTSFVGGWIDDTCIFLTTSEIDKYSFSQCATFKNAWYSDVFSDIHVQKVTVIYMDGTSETIKGSTVEASRTNATLRNGYFEDDVHYYNPVYEYRDYWQLNPDLKEQFGYDQYKYFDHFITTGMAEGRQANRNFNLAAYKANNPDLVAAFGDDNVKYYQHYITTGKAEGRKAT